MSQRCLVSFRKNVTQEDSFYDCIYDENGSLEVLLRDWLAMRGDGLCLGPWKLSIRDESFFPGFTEDFKEIKRFCPQLKSLDDLWGIWVDGVCVQDNPPEWLSSALGVLSNHLSK